MKAYVFKNELVNAVQKKREGRAIEYAKDTEMPFAECVVLETEEDAFLRDFFRILGKHIEKIKQANRIKSGNSRDYVRQITNLDELVRKYAAQRAELVKKLQASGVEVEENYFGPGYTIGGITSGLGNLDYREERFNYAITFNKAEITKEMLTDPEHATSFEKLYEEEKAKNVERAKRVKELKRKLRRNRFLRGLTKEEVSAIKSEIAGLKYDISTEKYYGRDYRVFSNLTDEQKQWILQYMEATEAIEKGVRAIRSLQKEFHEAEPTISSAEMIDEALSRMQANGMSEEVVEDVFTKLDEVASKRKEGHYDKRGKLSASKISLAREFITDVYGFDEEQEKQQGDSEVIK